MRRCELGLGRVGGDDRPDHHAFDSQGGSGEVDGDRPVALASALRAELHLLVGDLDVASENRLVVSALVERRARLEEDWVAESGEPERIWYELHQGARRPDTVERIELIRGLHPILAWVGAVVPFAPVAVYPDRASESEARGDYADERCALEAAVESVVCVFADPRVARPVSQCFAAFAHGV